MDIACTTSPAGSYFRRSRRTVCMVFEAGKRFLSDKIKNPIVRIALVGVGLSALFLLLYQGRYSVWEPI